MPLFYDNELEGGGRISIWRMDETIEELQKFVTASYFLKITSQYIHPLRKKQKICIFLLTRELFQSSGLEFAYTLQGRPYPTGDTQGFMSISHSGNYVSVIWHPTFACGIDLEIPGERIFRIAPRFLHDSEEKWIQPEKSMNELHLIWGVKECLFKLSGQEGVVFKEMLRVSKPELNTANGGRGDCMAIFKNHTTKARYHYRHLEDLLLVYTIAIHEEKYDCPTP